MEIEEKHKIIYKNPDINPEFGKKIVKYMWSTKFDKIQDITCQYCNIHLDLLPDLDGEESKYGWWDMTCQETLEFICPKCERYYLCCPDCSQIPEDYEEIYEECGDIYEETRECKPVNELQTRTGNIYLQQFLGWTGSYSNRDYYRFNTTNENIIRKYFHGSYEYEEHIKMYINESNNRIKESDIINEDKATRDRDIIQFYVGDKNYYSIDEIDINKVFGIDDCMEITGPDGGFPHYWKCPKCKEISHYTDK